MDYLALAEDLLSNMHMLHKARPHKNISESLQGESFVLHFIALHDCEVLPGEISQEMDVSSARVAAALNSLENKGLITRRIDKTDRRKILVGITPEGKKFEKEHFNIAKEKAAQLLSLLGEKDAKEYVRITGKLSEIIEQHTELH